MENIIKEKFIFKLIISNKGEIKELASPYLGVVELLETN